MLETEENNVKHPVPTSQALEEKITRPVAKQSFAETGRIKKIATATQLRVAPLDNSLLDDKSTVNTEALNYWAASLEILAKKLKKPSFETWILPNLLLEIQGDFAIIAVHNEFTRNFLLQSFAKDIQESLKEVTGKSLALNFVIDENFTSPFLEKRLVAQSSPSQQTKISELDRKGQSAIKSIENYAFNNLVLSDFNKSAFNFTKAIIENASGIYKALIVYSGSGLGKTHLLQAAQREASQKKRSKYCLAEKFINELIIAIQRNETQQFRQNYRSLDLIIIDDLNFFDNKKSCQEELAYTLESISNANGAFIVSSSKKISEFKHLNPKLKSLLQGALVAELDKPNLNDRVELIRQKSERLKLFLNNEQITQLAQKKVESIREIDGFLLQLSAEINLNHQQISDELLSNTFGGLFNRCPNLGLSLEKISKITAEYFGIAEKDLRGLKRAKEFMQARHLAIYLSYQLLELSYGRIGEHYSGRKHSSIIHSISTIKRTLESKLPSAKATEKLIEELKTRLSE